MANIPDSLPTIGKATLVLLRQHGCTTSRDVVAIESSSDAQIPGVGPVKWAVLMDWARRALDFHERVQILDDYVAALTTAQTYDFENHFLLEIESSDGKYLHYSFRDSPGSWHLVEWWDYRTQPGWRADTVHSAWFREQGELSTRQHAELLSRIATADMDCAAIVADAASRADAIHAKVMCRITLQDRRIARRNKVWPVVAGIIIIAVVSLLFLAGRRVLGRV